MRSINSIDNVANQLTAKYATFLKVAYIRKLPNGKYRVFSEKGKNLGTYPSLSQAKKRLRQIEFFKHKKASSDAIDLTDLDALSYSAVIRELRQQCDDETVQAFLACFKRIFDRLVLNGEKDPAEKALPAALMEFSKRCPIDFDEPDDE